MGQNGVLGAILGVGAKLFGGNPLGMHRLLIYAFSDIFGPNLTRRVVALGKVDRRRSCCVEQPAVRHSNCINIINF